MLERAQGSAARESMVAADEKRVHSPAELANRNTSYSSSSSIVPVASFQKKPHVVESRQYILAGLRVEGPEPHAFVHSDVEARRLIEFRSNTLHESEPLIVRLRGHIGV